MEYDSPVGGMVLAAEGDGITGLWFRGQKYFPAELGQPGDSEALRRGREWLDRYFAGLQPEPGELILMPRGSEFRRLVWQQLLQIPYGSTVTYSAIAAECARRMGVPRMSAQAVGGAVGHNPISIIIPCHRVLSAAGSLTGYAGGIEKKEWLLRFEASGL